MVEGFHELANVAEVGDVSEFSNPRARALVDAVCTNRDFSVVRLLKSTGATTPSLEVIVADVECDGVPSKNTVGIEYRERVALCVPADPMHLVEVLALRKAFPVLMHQNHGARIGPASLCLYFEPAKSVSRTWTPQRFLRRLQWWLEQSSKGELHPADQPVEHLFFASKYELVLPWNVNDLRRDETCRFAVARGPSRPDSGFTCFLKAIPKHGPAPEGMAAHVELNLPPIVQGFVERDPTTLGELAELLAARGVDLLVSLKTALSDGVSTDGVSVEAPETFVVVILHIPMTRAAGVTPDRTVHRAFLIQSGVRSLGVATGALQVYARRYYRDDAGAALGAKPATAWQNEPVFPMDVLRINDAASARAQSSIADDGPTGTLVGAGSLGSALLNLWGRSGWGRWTVVDKDHVKPHNLVRHVAFVQHIGELKSNVVAELHGAANDGATTVTSVAADATDTGNDTVRQALRTSQLVVDASAALDYPRLASGAGGLARHVSVFITPDGNGAVLMAEDAGRSIRLRSLEAQYYRAMIRQAWGAHHLDGNLGTYWSGASCRDISVALPYSRITAHAATLAEQVMAVSRRDAATIRIWQREPYTGGVVVHEVETSSERRLDFDSLSVYLDEGLAAHLKQLRASSLPAETGGVLLGYFDFNVNAIVVVDVLPAPPDSKGTITSFERGVAGLPDAVNEATRRTAGIVGYIGEWHSHPPGHSASPSRDDMIQLAEIALGMHDDGLPVLQLIVGDGDIQVLQGAVRG
jgi:integrative and conjugative element protein (TIGR02256 family)